tara:strand:+ start:3939 stop:4340 length:402 start_codon:yes stop_codon:yes gene_type:complete
MSFLEEIATYIQAQGHGDIGTDIFGGEMPDQPDACIAVYESEGREPGETFGNTPPVYDRPHLQILVRGERNDYETPMALCQAIRTDLATLVNTSLSGTYYLRVAARGSAHPIGDDGQDRYKMAANFIVFKEPS